MRSVSYRVRRTHRYLGLFIGIQFILWTVGGLYFSWTSIDDVHGDPLHAVPARLLASATLASPTAVIEQIRRAEPVDSIAGLDLVAVLGQPTYRISYFSAGRRKTRLGDAVSGSLRNPLSREEALQVARAEFRPGSPVAAVRYLTAGDVGGHHEYREQPLPAWAVTFDHPSGATAYVAAETGTLVRIRNGKWRAFDFLWMLHTMDYQGRDNFNNWVLRAFSILGLITVSSGFLLFWLTSRLRLNRVHQKVRARSPRAARATVVP